MHNFFKFFDWVYATMGSVVGMFAFIIFGQIFAAVLSTILCTISAAFTKWVWDLLKKRYEPRVLASLKRLENKIFKKNKQ